MKRQLGLHGIVVASPAPQLSTRSPSGDGPITDRRIATSAERFTAVFGTRPRACILLETSTESEWVARHLESLGHEVIVADPNDAPMSGNRSRAPAWVGERLDHAISVCHI